MKCARWFCRAAVALASLGLITPEVLVAAAPEAIAPATAVVDLALADGGSLHGQVVDGDGTVQANAKVMVWHQGTSVAATTTDAEGNFAISGLHAGVHQVAAGTGITTYRLWAPNTAPPVAKSRALVVNNSQIARGNGGGGVVRVLTNPWVLAGLVAAAIAVPVALNNNNHSGS